MKYTRDFEMYWRNATGQKKDVFRINEISREEEIKLSSFRAWKAGQKNIKYKYDLNGKI